jgi:large subunit ribosomal protein L22
MAEYKYAYQGFRKELMARAVGRDLSISPKVAIEICNYLRHRKLTQAKSILERVMEEKQAIPYRRFTNGPGHRAGKMTTGRYPFNASKAILSLLESVEANAQSKGLNTGELEIAHICAQRAAEPRHYGRSSGRSFKRAHVEVVVMETPKKEQSKGAKKPKEGKKAAEVAK